MPLVSKNDSIFLKGSETLNGWPNGPFLNTLSQIMINLNYFIV